MNVTAAIWGLSILAACTALALGMILRKDKCPRCGTRNTEPKERVKWIRHGDDTVPVFRPGGKCLNCGHEWVGEAQEVT